MIRHHFQRPFLCLILGVLSVSGLRAEDSKVVAPPAGANISPTTTIPTTTLAPMLESVQKQLTDIQISLQSLKAQDSEVRLRKLETDLALIRDQLSRIESSLKLSKGESRTSFSISPAAVPAVPTGTIRLSNTSAYYASVTMGGLIYRIAPGQVLPITGQPVGDFKYDVQADGFGLIQPATQRTLGKDEVFTIFIYPR
ncbi:MAG: hypothetical protein EXS11_07875 [Gemmataceae bacterium]|nr:hypothetical protein [Gemmataceae bacterium]